MVSSINGVFCAVLFSSVILGSKCEDQVNAKPGEDIVLQCQAPRGAAIGLIQWTRPDLKSGDVFFYRDGNSHDNYQHASFRGRVKLRDPQMKDGDVSVILQNVTINDAGRYDCRIIINSGSTEPATPQLMNNIHLMVTESDQLKAKPGEDVLLQCQAPRGAIRLLEWIRPDLQHDGNVFFYRNYRVYENFQHQSFRGRVELRDSKMKDGDVSVILNNVSISDTGTYICRIIATEGDQDRMGTEFLSVTNLTVTEEMDSSLISHLSSHYLLTGGGAGHTEDRGKTDKMITNGENKDLIVGLFVGLSVVAVILGLFAFMIITKRKCVKETYRRVSQRTGEHSYTDKCIFGTCCSTEA